MARNMAMYSICRPSLFYNMEIQIFSSKMDGTNELFVVEKSVDAHIQL